MSSERSPLVIPKTSRRELILGLTVGLVVIAIVIFSLLRLSGSAVEGRFTGNITAKHFVPYAPESQISVGSSGVMERKSDGDYAFTVQVPGTKSEYTVWVDPTIYQAHQVGDSFSFPRPLPGP